MSTLCNPMDCSMPGFPVLHCLPEFTQIQVHWVMLSNNLTLCCPLLLWPSTFPRVRVFFKKSTVYSGGQIFGALASALVLPMNIQHWFPSGLTGLTSLLSKRHPRVYSSTTVWKHQLWCSAFFRIQLSHPYVTTGKTIVPIIWTFVVKVMSGFWICCQGLS